ncbi:dihydrofolate reductase family protein [uncultured Algimonas sp.]|uniref:dihydrofolate reductase family protein n=1 Tax=uncultured Algimonas sp. TaxID=1547920 RepID=UPI002634BC8A|nr:dihydrofolate reductase family protein [uncultured Algimonas sp.]
MPTLHLSCAVSADGYLDDTSPQRAVLSSPEDLDAVLALRARMDMIVIGAETLRRDDPSLATRGAAHIAARAAAGRAPDPIKVVITRSGDIPHDRAFFRTGTAETIVLSASPTHAPPDRAKATVEHFMGDPIEAVLGIATARGLSDILIEGGAQMLRLALPRARRLRLAVSPRAFGDAGHARLFGDLDAFLAPLHIASTERLGDTTVHHIDLLLSRARPLMGRAFDLSAQCPPSATAFAVGAVACSEDLSVLATGYSRETGPTDHAEEALLSKLDGSAHTVICTLEPCLTRASKPTGCAERLVASGLRRLIYAVAEDETFTRQTGLAFLRNHGVDVLHLPGYESRFRALNAPVYAAS